MKDPCELVLSSECTLGRGGVFQYLLRQVVCIVHITTIVTYLHWAHPGYSFAENEKCRHIDIKQCNL